MFNGILYQLKNGCNWQDLPKDFPPYSTVYWHLHSVASCWGIQGTNECLTWTSS
ncbi:transposase [Nostoc sp.]|uniref:transposase n=1 Tax=Nostoc sp. TaxID=1180 RepID=UPI003FA56F42